MAVKKREEKVGEALLKVALGCRVEEVTEEYAEVDGELKLTKRRETKKDIPPDLKAVQMLLAAKEDGADYAAMSWRRCGRRKAGPTGKVRRRGKARPLR